MTAAPELPKRRQAVVKGDRVEVIVKSGDRVKAYGEVFTPAHMVEKMLDLVKPELETGTGFVDKTLLETFTRHGYKRGRTTFYRRDWLTPSTRR